MLHDDGDVNDRNSPVCSEWGQPQPRSGSTEAGSPSVTSELQTMSAKMSVLLGVCSCGEFLAIHQRITDN